MTSRTQPLLIALTGGIASGKSAVADVFASLGVPVLDTDRISRDVAEPGSPALEQIVEAFGPDVLDAMGGLDRARMRSLVFADPSQRRKLESITHPAIRAELARRSAQAGGEYQVHVIPLLIETGRRETYGRVLVVDAPEEMQLHRLMQRDGATRKQAMQILAAQVTRKQRLAAADDVVANTGTLEELRELVETLHRKYLSIARGTR